MSISAKGFLEINGDMVQILLMLEVLFTQDSKAEDLFCGAPPGSEPSPFFSNYLSSSGLGTNHLLSGGGRVQLVGGSKYFG